MSSLSININDRMCSQDTTNSPFYCIQFHHSHSQQDLGHPTTGDRIEQQVPQVHQISKDERLCEFRSRHLDGILQFLCDVWQREPHVREEGDDGHEPGTGVEIRSWHHVVEVWCQETRTPVAPYHSVGLFVGMPTAKGHTQPITSRTADARRVINELKHKQCSININRHKSRKKTI